MHRKVEEDFAGTHGRLRGQETAILALGRLGAREMTANSDLDLIVIYDFDGKHPNSDGKRPLYGAQYFARLTQRLISALTVQTNYGVLYQVDMRLRPSGRSGPLATQIGGFESYQEREAWTWEHMALTRARVVSGSAAFSVRIEAVIRAVLCRKRDARAIAADVVEMRGAIAKEKGDANPWDLKYAAGGLVDIEFIAQYLQLCTCRDGTGNSRHHDGARARESCAPRCAGAGGRRRAAPRRAPVSRSHASAAAVPAGRVRSENRERRRTCACSPAPPTCRIFRRCRRTSRKRSVRCAACFVRILGNAP